MRTPREPKRKTLHVLSSKLTFKQGDEVPAGTEIEQQDGSKYVTEWKAKAINLHLSMGAETISQITLEEIIEE